MPRVHSMGTPPVSSATTTRSGSAKGGIGEAMKVFGDLMYKSQMQKGQQDAAMERSLIANDWYPMDTSASMGGESPQPSTQGMTGPNEPQSSIVPRNMFNYSNALAGSAGIEPQQQGGRMVPRSMLNTGQLRQQQQGGQAGTGSGRPVTIGGQQYDVMKRVVNGKSYAKLIKREPTRQELMAEKMQEYEGKQQIELRNKQIGRGVEAIADRLKLEEQRTYDEDRAIVKSTQDLTDKKDVITHRESFQGYKPKDEAAAIRLREAGRDVINIGAKEERAGETHDIKIEQTASNALSDLQTNLRDKKAFNRSAAIYNKTTVNKQVAWWDEGEGVLNLKGTEFTVIPPDKVKEGVTPARIQKLSDASGKSVKEILQELGILK